MKFIELYTNLGINSELIKHHLRVASLSYIIASNWKGDNLDKELLILAALTHDIGNLAKYDLINHPELLGEDVKDLEEWKRRQKKFITKYGDDDHEATKKVLSELICGKDWSLY